MTKIVGIRFRNVGKIYYFDPKNYKMKIGDHVIVETARGVEFGRVVLGPKEVGEDEVVHPLKEVLRVATQADEDREKQNRLKEKDLPPDISSMEYVRELIEAVPTSANVKYYANIVSEKALLRRLIRATEDVANTCYLEKESTEMILEESEKS